MKVKTHELSGEALDYAVAMCEFASPDYEPDDLLVYVTVGSLEDEWVFSPSADWSIAGPIIEKEMITVGPAKHAGFMAWAWPKENGIWGDTALEAAMRCYVSTKLGLEIDIPEELAQ